MSQVRTLVITGSHAAKHERIRTILTQAGELGNADLLACEEAVGALADEKHRFHSALMVQVETAIRLHDPERILMVGPNGWAAHVRDGRSINRTSEMLLLMTVQDNLKKAFPRLKNLGHIVLNEGELRRATRDVAQPFVLGCIDPRFLRGYLRRAARRAHLSTLAGATCAISDPMTEALVLHQIDLLRPSRIVLRPHMDCKKVGANEDREEHMARHREHASRSFAVLGAKFPHIPVSCRMLDFHGTIPLPVGA